jgi:hypothetical protein
VASGDPHVPPVVRETTVTLQDVAMILGLPIDDTTVCGSVAPVGWRDSIGEAIIIQPPDVVPNNKDKKLSSVHSGWLTTNFHFVT